MKSRTGRISPASDPGMLSLGCGQRCVGETRLMPHQLGRCSVTAKPCLDLAAEASGQCGCSESEGEERGGEETIGRKLTDTQTNTGVCK